MFKTKLVGKHLSLATLACVVLSTASSSLAQQNATCVNADPSATLAGISGDSEFLVDPQDPAQNVIYTNNVASGASNVVVAHIDGVSGLVVPGSLHVVANNFNGNSVINGPSWVQTPGGELGIIYAGPGGVYGVFRPPVPKVWYDFSLDITGALSNGSPTILPTSIGQYPLSSNPLGHSTYGQTLGHCNANGAFPLDWCFGALGFGVATDLQAVLSPQGFTISDAVQSPRDGYFFMSACRVFPGRPNGLCGLFEGQIDNAGGLVSNTVTLVAQTQQAAANIAADRHPVTGTTVVFSEHGSSLIDVWEQPASGGALKLIANVPTSTPSHHYTTDSDTTQLVLEYYGPQKGVGGSFTIPVTASEGRLVAGPSKLISVFNNGSELVFLPAANQWAFYVYSPFERCFVIP